MRRADVPSNPHRTCEDGGWQAHQGWAHWLDTGKQHTKEFLPFGHARDFATTLGLASVAGWMAGCKQGRRPPNVPSQPHRTREDGGWQGSVGALAGHGHRVQDGKRRFLPLGEALAPVLSQPLAGAAARQAW